MYTLRQRILILYLANKLCQLKRELSARKITTSFVGFQKLGVKWEMFLPHMQNDMLAMIGEFPAFEEMVEEILF